MGTPTTTYKCEDCEDEVYEPEADGPWDCIICGGRMMPVD